MIAQDVQKAASIVSGSFNWRAIKVNIHVHEGGNNVKERFLERQRQIIKNKKHLKGNLKIIAIAVLGLEPSIYKSTCRIVYHYIIRD